jgi:hypothetical protein
MSDRDARFVHLSPSMSQAGLVVATLKMNGVAARVIDESATGGMQGLALTGNDGGMEVWVDDPAQAEEARQIIEELKQVVIESNTRAQKEGPIDVICEKCNKSHHFEAEYRGTVQECPSCGSFIDLYEGDDSMEWDTAEVDEDDPELGSNDSH